jgi:hypothetical protein
LKNHLDNAQATRRTLLVAKAQDKKQRVKVLKPKAKTYLVAKAKEKLTELVRVRKP